MIKCSHCGRENDDSFKFCLDCGNPLTAQAGEEQQKPTEPASPATPAPAQAEPKSPAAQGACPKCGEGIGADDVFCASCGQDLAEAPGRGATMFMHTAAPDAVDKPKFRLVLVKPDGSEGTVFTLTDRTAIGRTQGMIMFPKDPYISPRHTEIKIENGTLTISDLGTLNGVYRRMTTEESIVPGTYFRIGRQLLRLEVPGQFQALNYEVPEGDDSHYWGSPTPQVWARLVQVLEGGKIGEIHMLTQAEVVIGREHGGVRFPEDGFISSRHCKLVNKDGDCFLIDLGSSNGTYLRIKGDHVLNNGDRIQIGNQVLRADIS